MYNNKHDWGLLGAFSEAYSKAYSKAYKHINIKYESEIMNKEYYNTDRY